MAKLNAIEIADGLGPLEIKSRDLTLEDFHENVEIHQMYLMMMELAKQWDKESTTSLVIEKVISKK